MFILLAVQVLFHVSRNGRKQPNISVQILTRSFIYRKLYLSGKSMCNNIVPTTSYYKEAALCNGKVSSLQLEGHGFNL